MTLDKFKNLMIGKGGSNKSESKVFLVTTAAQTEKIVSFIKDTKARDSKKEIVLGLDCEGLHVTKSLSLLQVGLDELTSIIDAFPRINLYIRSTISQPV